MSSIAEFFIRDLVQNPAYKGTPMSDFVMQRPQMRKVAALPQFQQRMSQMARSGSFNKGQALAALADYDPEAYANQMFTEQKVSNAAIQDARRANAVQSIPVANDNARKFKLGAVEVNKLKTRIDALNGQLTNEKNPENIALIEKELLPLQEDMDSKLQEMDGFRKAYDSAIITIAEVPGLSSYVTAKLEDSETAALDRMMKKSQADLQQIRLKTEPALAEAATKSAKANARMAQLKEQELKASAEQGDNPAKLAQGFLQRMITANPNITPLSKAQFIKYSNDGMASLFGAPTNVIAAKDFIAAVLRRESGAAISPSEFSSTAVMLIPVESDPEDSKVLKAQNRLNQIDAMRRSARTASGGLGVEDNSSPSGGGAALGTKANPIVVGSQAEKDAVPAGQWFKTKFGGVQQK